MKETARRIARSAALAATVLLRSATAAAQERPIPLDTVQVTVSSVASAEMASSTRAVQVIGREAIRSMPARTLPEVLQWAIGVDLMPRSPALVDVGLRGSSFEQVLVMVDGVRVSDAQTGHFDLDLAVPLDQVERVEVLRGPASTLHGADAVGGVINVVTRRGGGTTARAEVGTFGTLGTALAHTVTPGATRIDLGVDLRRSDGHRSGADYEVGQGRVAVAAPLGRRRVEAAVAWAARNFGARGFYGSNPDWNEYERTRATTASLALRGDPDDRLAHESVMSYRRHHDDFVLLRQDPSFYQNLHTTHQTGGKVSARYAAAPQVRLAAAGEVFHDRLESMALGDRSEARAAMLGEVAAGRVGSFTAAAGARLDWHEAHGAFVAPSVSAGWWPLRSVRLRASVARALRAPTWTERFYRDPANRGSADLSPERSWSTEVGVDVTPAAGTRFGAALYRRESEQLIDWSRAAAGDEPWVTRNVQSASFRGLEAWGEIESVAGVRWTAQGSWLSVRSSTPAGMESKYALRPLSESITLGADRSLPGGIGIALRAARARRVGEEAYFRADARLTIDVRSTRVYADLHNLGNADYLDIAGIGAPGRSVLVGVEWRSD